MSDEKHSTCGVVGRRQGSRKRMMRWMALGILFVGMTCLPLNVFAKESESASSAIDAWSTAQKASTDPSSSPYSYAWDDPTSEVEAKNGIAVQSGVSLPATLDLRTRGVVTPVKYQNPWGTCWGFSAIAASETSILTDLGTTYATSGLDLSELQLAYFVYYPTPESQGTQAGEGFHISDAMAAKNPNYGLQIGGEMVYATTLFSSGTGPLYEKYIPYKNAEDVIYCSVKLPSLDKTISMPLDEDAIAALEAQGATVTKRYHAKTIYTVDEMTGEKSSPETPATWKVDDSYYASTSFELEESNILPEYRILDSKGNYIGTSEDAIEATKRELYEGRAISVGFYADQSRPGKLTENAYIDVENWAHYTYKEEVANHAVTIVG